MPATVYSLNHTVQNGTPPENFFTNGEDGLLLDMEASAFRHEAWMQRINSALGSYAADIRYAGVAAGGGGTTNFNLASAKGFNKIQLVSGNSEVVWCAYDQAGLIIVEIRHEADGTLGVYDVLHGGANVPNDTTENTFAANARVGMLYEVVVGASATCVFVFYNEATGALLEVLSVPGNYGTSNINSIICGKFADANGTDINTCYGLGYVANEWLSYVVGKKMPDVRIAVRLPVQIAHYADASWATFTGATAEAAIIAALQTNDAMNQLGTGIRQAPSGSSNQRMSFGMTPLADVGVVPGSIIHAVRPFANGTWNETIPGSPTGGTINCHLRFDGTDYPHASSNAPGAKVVPTGNTPHGRGGAIYSAAVPGGGAWADSGMYEKLDAAETVVHLVTAGNRSLEVSSLMQAILYTPPPIAAARRSLAILSAMDVFD